VGLIVSGGLTKLAVGRIFYLLNPCSRCSHFHPYYENVVLSESSNLISYLISFYAPCRRGLVCFLLSCTSCVIHIVIHLRFHWLMSPGACVDFHSWGPIRNRFLFYSPPVFLVTFKLVHFCLLLWQGPTEVAEAVIS